MKISYNWLKEFVDFDKTPEQLADDLSLFGHEVESIEKVGDDFVLDFEITPNRGDCLSILGMAREIAALYGAKLKSQNSNLKIEETDINKSIQIKIEKPEICPRFTSRIIDNIKIGESPKWMQEKLATYGFRPINNIVDITNYVMVATGQPLHAFDFDKIKNGLINIRLSKKGEEVMTLDGQNRILNDGAIITEDDEKIFDLAGIMGGLKSEVDEKTKTIVLQGAIFDPVLIRQTSKFLNHSTDASYRYERGADFEGTIYSVNLAASLIVESCQANPGPLIDIVSQAENEIKISYDALKINRLLGTDFTNEQISDYLTQLNIKTNANIAAVPSYRRYDLAIWQDLAEEVARVYGYNNLEKYNFEFTKAKKNIEFTGTEKIKDILVELGFDEIYSYSFTDIKALEILGFEPNNQPQIEKPLSPETEFLQPNLLSSFLTAIAKNPWSPEINIFEMEAVFLESEEKWQLGIATVGKSDTMLKDALKALGLEGKIEGVEQKILDHYKIRRPVKYALFDIDDIKLPEGNYSLEISKNKYKPISKYPPTVRDLSFVFDGDANENEIIDSIKSVSQKIFITELFDTYRMNDDKKSLAFHIWMQDMSRPMQDKEVETIINDVINVISRKYNAEHRKKS